MDYEKAYKEALERAKYFKENTDSDGVLDISTCFEQIFPELRESEDEMIRNAVLKAIMTDEGRGVMKDSGFKVDDILYWLEKKGEKTIPKNIDNAALQYVDTCAVDGEVTHDNIIEPYWNNHSMMAAYKAGWLEKQGSISNINEKLRQYREYLIKETERWYRKLEDETLSKTGKQDCIGHANAYVSARSEFEDIFNYDSWIEKQGEPTDKIVNEKSPIDKVEPKFRVGDWVTNGHVTYQIIDSRYWYSETCVLGNVTDIDKTFHLYTIQDAKDGDVLAFDDETIVIFKDLYNSTTFHSYCHIEEGAFNVSQDDMPDWWEGKGFHPATKEQCYFLFQKMKEAGYEWDAENKQLKEIEQNPSWSKEDDEKLRGICMYLMCSDSPEGYTEWIDWLKSLKERMKGE